MPKYLQNILVDFRKKLKTENSPFCRPIYYPLTEATEFFLYTTTNVSERRRIWSSQIFHFQTFVTQTFDRSLRWFSILSRKLKFWKSTKISQFWEFFTGIRKIVRNKWRVPNSSSRRADCRGIKHFSHSHCLRGVISNDRRWPKPIANNICILLFYENLSMLWAHLLPFDRGYRKTFICHDDVHGKENVLVILILSHRLLICSKICESFQVFSKKVENWKSINIVSHLTPLGHRLQNFFYMPWRST